MIIANGLHVNALPRARSACGAKLVRHFIETLEVGDTRCAAEGPPVRLVGVFARHAAELEPAQALGANQANDLQLRFVRAAVLTAGDVVTRVGLSSSGQGVGLRGGRFTLVEHRGAQVASLDAVRWTLDLAVSGSSRKRAVPTGACGRILSSPARIHSAASWRSFGKTMRPMPSRKSTEP